MEQMKTLTIGEKTYIVVDAAAVKTVNGISPDEEGNLIISTGKTVEFTVDAEGNAIIK